MPKYITDLTSNAKYGDKLHPDVSKQYLHLPNYILSHTNHCNETNIYITLYDINTICQFTELDVLTFNKEVIMMY